jgi:hypothetical protein
MRLEEWGIRKNKTAANIKNRVLSPRSLETTHRKRSYPEGRQSNVISDMLADSSSR